MNKTSRIRMWLRWAMLLPLMGVFGESSCSVSDAAREVADGLNNAANSLDGHQESDFNKFVDDVQNLFD